MKLVIFLMFLLSLSAEAQTARFVPGEVLVKYKGGGLRPLSVNSFERLKVSVPVSRAVSDLMADPGVEFAQPNYIYELHSLPNDPKFGESWGARNTGQTVSKPNFNTNNPGVTGRDMNLAQAWDIRTDCSQVVVAVIDTGVNYNHEDLRDNMWISPAYPKHGYDFIGGDDDPMDVDGHGTNVAGIIGARGNNGVGMAGVCWIARIMALRAGNETGFTTENVVKAVHFAADNGAKLMNLSIGLPVQDPALDTALNYAADKGLLIVTSAGNAKADVDAKPQYPCNSPAKNLICVAALDQAYQLAEYSNYGARSVHIAAPGNNIWSTFAGVVQTMNDTFLTNGNLNWTRTTGDWSYRAVAQPGGGSAGTIANPSNYDGQNAVYRNNMDAHVYKTFNLAGFDAVYMTVDHTINLAGGDVFNGYATTAGGDPFRTGSQVFGYDGVSYDGTLSYDMRNCMVANCTVGFGMQTDASVASAGVAIYGVTFTFMKTSSNAYAPLSGTSQATPYIAGLAALLFAQNPAYTAADVREAILAGADLLPALVGKVRGAGAADAYGSITYIQAPSGLTVGN